MIKPEKEFQHWRIARYGPETYRNRPTKTWDEAIAELIKEPFYFSELPDWFFCPPEYWPE